MLLEASHRQSSPGSRRLADPLLQKLCRIAELNPEKTAVIDARGSYSYYDIFSSGRTFSAALQNAGIGPNANVALSMRKECSYIEAVIGCLLSGNAFLPIDPNYPPERKRHMIADSGAVAAAINFDMCTPVDVPILLDTRTLPPGNAPDFPDELRAAYTIYTSGTTGRPKGVPIESAALADFIAVQGATLAVTGASRFASIASISFDMSIWELFMALCHGATLVMLDRDTIVDGRKLGAALDAHAVSHLLMTPSMLSLLPAGAYPALRYVVSAGEKCGSQNVKTWSPVTHFFDAYGATEATIYTTIVRKTPDTPPACVGQPMAGSGIAIIDSNGREVNNGETGEICIVGNAVSRGYHNRPELNANVFIELDGKRAYRTGDIGYLDESGFLFCKGRLDRQVKFNGYRIELEEIERVANETLLVAASAAALHTSESGKTFLYLFVVPRDETDFKPLAFREALRRVLPMFMMPSRIFAVPAMPVTSSGKADISRLMTLAHEN
ncbi:amino acid adenylation domain-containing protein [Burkholderia stagnalis]|uniref:amino acid adenylation domain-containing protein n=1 Tax=Burkholderia stagnalis TaxID=1503054 RepID=UPI0009BDFFE5|nr:amino acid adenylation domain-containing protein [Burkholderia stagnalis]